MQVELSGLLAPPEGAAVFCVSGLYARRLRLRKSKEREEKQDGSEVGSPPIAF